MFRTRLNANSWRIFTILLVFALVTGCIQPIQPVTEQPTDYVAEEVTFPNGDITFGGTLTLPKTAGPHPAVILISGSGQQDRDEALPMIPNYKPFQFIADHLTRQGIAVLRYDDRGVGQSTGDPSSATSADSAQDAEAALTYLLTHPAIDPKQIGFLGHSEGSLIAAMIAARNPTVAFVISMAGPAVNGYDLLLLQSERILRTTDVTEEEITTAMAEQRQSLDLIVAGDWAALEALLLEVGHRQIDAMPPEQKKALGDPDLYLKQQIDKSMVSTKGWLRYFLTYNPADDWAQVKVPVLALFGGLDTQVDQAQNLPAMEAALVNNPDVTVRLFDQANHLFQEAVTGSPEEYATLPAAFLPGFLDTISAWLLARVDVQGGMNAELADWTVVTNADYGYQFRIPPGWQTQAITITQPDLEAPIVQIAALTPPVGPKNISPI